MLQYELLLEAMSSALWAVLGTTLIFSKVSNNELC